MITKCLFPAAGYGTRFLPATKAMPKEMLPIVSKPLIQYGVEEAIEAGLTDIGIISGRGKRAIEDHFDISYELEHQIAGSSKEALLEDVREIIKTCTFSYTRQVEMKGLGHAILTGERLVGDKPFGVLLADDFCTNGVGVLKQMVDLYSEYQCSIVAIEEVPPDQTDKYGVIEGKEIQPGLFKISNMVEKPAPEDAPTTISRCGSPRFSRSAAQASSSSLDASLASWRTKPRWQYGLACSDMQTTVKQPGQVPEDAHSGE